MPAERGDVLTAIVLTEVQSTPELLCTGLLGVRILTPSLSHGVFIGTATDAGVHGVPDTVDNGSKGPNGPDLSTAACEDQEDADADGFGNPCDTDFSSKNETDLDDGTTVLGALKVQSTDPTYDVNCDSAVDLDDVSRTLSDSKIGKRPGSSLLAGAASRRADRACTLCSWQKLRFPGLARSSSGSLSRSPRPGRSAACSWPRRGRGGGSRSSRSTRCR